MSMLPKTMKLLVKKAKNIVEIVIIDRKLNMGLSRQETLMSFDIGEREKN